jgi:hypothetical protein
MAATSPFPLHGTLPTPIHDRARKSAILGNNRYAEKQREILLPKIGVTPVHLLLLGRLRGQRAVYGLLLDDGTYPGTMLGVAGPLAGAADRRRFLAGLLPTDPTHAAWAQRQRWAFPCLAMCVAPILGNHAPPPDTLPPLPLSPTYRQEYVRCGKQTCTSCRTGPGHGPYTYAYWRADGRLHKRYLGKPTPPPSMPPTPP